ncbi:hypothetical protein G6F40_016868 [Rhizopus arrhizus]|nr:hypothetical protein G6F40_016868 [Rhizopus arrhizus]
MERLDVPGQPADIARGLVCFARFVWAIGMGVDDGHQRSLVFGASHERAADLESLQRLFRAKFVLRRQIYLGKGVGAADHHPAALLRIAVHGVALNGGNRQEIHVAARKPAVGRLQPKSAR